MLGVQISPRTFYDYNIFKILMIWWNGRHGSFRSYIIEGSSPSIRKLFIYFFFYKKLQGSSLIGRVSSCHGEVCGFESRLPRKNK